MIESQRTHLRGPKLRLEHNGYALLFVEPFVLANSQQVNCIEQARVRLGLPLWALYMRATLSMLPVMKKIPSGDQARSYISEPDERHMCLTRQVSLSSSASSPNVGACE